MSLHKHLIITQSAKESESEESEIPTLQMNVKTGMLELDYTSYDSDSQVL